MTTKPVVDLPSSFLHRGVVELADIVRAVVADRLVWLIDHGHITDPVQCWGVVLGRKFEDYEFSEYWDHPLSWIALAVGDGRDQEREIQDAVRSARATARTLRDTMELVEAVPELFRNVVPSMGSDEADPYSWGDRDIPGAVLVSQHHHPCLVSFASSDLDPQWCDWMAREIANAIRTIRLQIDRRDR